MELHRLNESNEQNQQIASWLQGNINFPHDMDNLLGHQNVKAGVEMDVASRLPDAIPSIALTGVRVANELGDALVRITINYSEQVFDADFMLVDQ